MSWRKNLVWKIEIAQTAAKQIQKLDKETQRRIISFLRNKLENTSNPRLYGKALKFEKAGLWRYRVGDYRLICEIKDEIVTVLVLCVGHRKKIYR